jgi:hypothetical protein
MLLEIAQLQLLAMERIRYSRDINALNCRWYRAEHAYCSAASAFAVQDDRVDLRDLICFGEHPKDIVEYLECVRHLITALQGPR